MAYFASRKPPRAAYSQPLPVTKSGMTSRGTLSRPKPLGKPRLGKDAPSLRRVSF
jgi:hypothetical protein